MSNAVESTSYIHANHSGRTKVAIGFGVALPVIAVILRFIARKVRGLPIGASDYVATLAVLATLFNSLISIMADDGGNGRHMKTLSKATLETYALALFIQQQTFGVAVFLVKLSILLLYRSIFETQQFRRNTTIIGILTFIWMIVKGLVSAFQCSPVRKFWEKSLPGKCSLNFLNTVLGAQAFNVLLDIAILALPLTQISKLHLPKAKKLGVMAIFAVGIFDIITALLRLGIIAHEYYFTDITWTTAKFSWTIMDPAVGCVVACMPTYAPLFRLIKDMPNLYTSFRSLLTRSGRQSRTRISDHDESRAIHLQDFKKQDRVNTKAMPGAGSDEFQRQQVAYPGAVMVRRDFTQESHQRSSGASSPFAQEA